MGKGEDIQEVDVEMEGMERGHNNSLLVEDDFHGSDVVLNVNNGEDWKIPKDRLEGAILSAEQLKGLKRKQKQFYKHQNELVQSLFHYEKQANDDHSEEEREEKANKSATFKRMKKIAIYGSAAANILLFIIKLYAAIVSGSLSVIASALDSFLDLFSGLIIFFTEVIVTKINPENYPAGKSRFEPVGLVIFSACMFTATFQLLIRSVSVLISGVYDIDISYLTMGILIFTVVLKGILFLFCRTVKGSSSVQALAEDHRNDIISNSFGLTTALIGYFFWGPLDSIGAIFIAFYIMFIWARTGYEQFHPLTGAKATREFTNAITYIARQHHPDVLGIDTVRAYHLGYNYVVELDIIMDPNTPLRHAHDVGEALQNKLEKIEMVERAFVHLDYEGQHKPEHQNAGRAL